jgi:hypothetical protein
VKNEWEDPWPPWRPFLHQRSRLKRSLATVLQLKVAAKPLFS